MAIDMKELARYGAEARIKELQAEIEEIRRAFPAAGGAKRGRPRAALRTADTVAPVAKRRARKPMTAAQKKAVGDRMKRYWSERRKAKGAKKSQG